MRSMPSIGLLNRAPGFVIKMALKVGLARRVLLAVIGGIALLFLVFVALAFVFIRG
jgi:hypothetical protein